MDIPVTPQWIAPMYAGKVGRDHLGLGSVSSDQILPTLSPGINVLTVHPRYYSFYTFLLDEFWQQDHPRSYEAWKTFYRPREFIFSVGAHLCPQPEHPANMPNIVGSRKTTPLIQERPPTFNTHTNYIDSDLGGYGLYYRSVMAELGLIYPGGPGLPYPVDVPSEKGKQAAAFFRKGVQDTDYYRHYFKADKTDVPIGVVEAYIRQACLCQLQKQTTPDHAILLDVFLHSGAQAEARRSTFRLLLDIARQTTGFAVTQDTFRQLIYFGQADIGAAYRPSANVADSHKQWRLYQAREYYAFALNALWDYLCYWGIINSGDIRALPITRFWEHLTATADFGALALWLNLPKPNFDLHDPIQSLLNWLKALVNTDDAGFDAACTLHSPVQEHQLYQLATDNRTDPSIMVAGMVTMLALVYLRFSRPGLRLQPEWFISQMGDNGRLSVDGFIQAMKRWVNRGGATIEEVARWLYADYIILQHQLIATGKLPENTFRFRREGALLQFYNLPNALRFMDSRFDALSTTVYELGLCGPLWETKHALTAEGLTLLETGDLV